MAYLNPRFPVIDMGTDRQQLVIEVWLARLRWQLAGREALKIRRASRPAREQRADNSAHAAAPWPVAARASEPQCPLPW